MRDFKKKNAPKGCCLKIDLHKGFDSVNRDFGYFIVECMGFPGEWINWVKACLPSPSFSLLINGSPAGFFTSNRGIRQGDPLSPYIFVLVMEYWSIQIEIALASVKTDTIRRDAHKALVKIETIRRDAHNSVSHLMFADDMLVFLKASKTSMLTLCTMLEDLKQNTELTINNQQSNVYFSKGCTNREELKAIIGFTEGVMPTKYLGMRLSENYLKPINFSSLIGKCREKLEGWSSKTLSFSDRIELIKSVIHGIVSYWVQSYQLPVSTCRALDRLSANFYGKGKCKRGVGKLYVSQEVKRAWDLDPFKMSIKQLHVNVSGHIALLILFGPHG